MFKLFTTVVYIIIPWYLLPPFHNSNGYNTRKNNNNSIQCDDILQACQTRILDHFFAVHGHQYKWNKEIKIKFTLVKFRYLKWFEFEKQIQWGGVLDFYNFSPVRYAETFKFANSQVKLFPCLVVLINVRLWATILIK